jgi:hypothetical protein
MADFEAHAREDVAELLVMRQIIRVIRDRLNEDL